MRDEEPENINQLVDVLGLSAVDRGTMERSSEGTQGTAGAAPLRARLGGRRTSRSAGAAAAFIERSHP